MRKLAYVGCAGRHTIVAAPSTDRDGWRGCHFGGNGAIGCNTVQVSLDDQLPARRRD